MSLRTTISQSLSGSTDTCPSFRHFLYISTWVAMLIMIFKGDFAAIPDELQDEAAGTFWIWGGSALWAAPVAILADFLIRKSPPCKYRAMWLRQGADIAQAVSVLSYLVLRLYMGDYHVYSTAVLFAALGYCVFLTMRDAAQLIEVERLASRLEKKDV